MFQDLEISTQTEMVATLRDLRYLGMNKWAT